ncbi:unnamed protein product [Ilex paraguariensis]|uniref:EF-hand domain-containing protein n=1 Tax=Ilex paraguariensis TaxID=185542 RepID=A0ABC8UZ07_9AQUA
MKLIKDIPKKFFKSRKSRSVSRSDEPYSFSSGTTSSESSESSSSNDKSHDEPYSFSSGTASSESSESSSSNDKSHAGLKSNGLATPTSVLPSPSPVRDEWPEISANLYVELVEAFKLFDRDGDGKITTVELKALLSRVGAEQPSEEELTMMLSEVDRDGDGCVSLEEFSAISSAFGPPSCRSELKDAFDVFDTDHDGKITAEELFNVFNDIGDGGCTLEDCRRMIKGVDKNGDGFVCFEDFTRMMELQR